MVRRYATGLALLLAVVLLVGCGAGYGAYWYDDYWYDDPYWYDRYYWYDDYYWYAPSSEGFLDVEAPDAAPPGAAW